VGMLKPVNGFYQDINKTAQTINSTVITTNYLPENPLEHPITTADFEVRSHFMFKLNESPVNNLTLL
jgi:hypothetical protein